MSISFQGSETTATAISFVLLMMAIFPDIQVCTHYIFLIICHCLDNENYFHINSLILFHIFDHKGQSI